MKIADIRERVSGNLRAFRARKGISQVDLAAILEVNNDTVSSWERGRNAISLENAWLLADFYGISLDYLAGRNRLDYTETNHE